MGVDPGLSATGYGVVEGDGKRFELLEKGTVRPGPRHPLPERLWRIYEALEGVVERYSPDALAIEEVYLAKNLTAGMLTAQVTGVVKLLARGRVLLAYSPREVKKRITGNGSAPKEQVMGMVERLLGVRGLASDHAADALALAVCAIFDLR